MKKYLFCLFIAAGMISCGDDDANPVLTITSGTTYDVLAGESFDVVGTATDDLELVSVSFVSDGLGLNQSVSGADLAGSSGFTVTVNTDPTTPDGTYTLVITATDSGDNTDSESLTVNVSM